MSECLRQLRQHRQAGAKIQGLEKVEFDDAEEEEDEEVAEKAAATSTLPQARRKWGKAIAAHNKAANACGNLEKQIQAKKAELADLEAKAGPLLEALREAGKEADQAAEQLTEKQKEHTAKKQREAEDKKYDESQGSDVKTERTKKNRQGTEAKKQTKEEKQAWDLFGNLVDALVRLVPVLPGGAGSANDGATPTSGEGRAEQVAKLKSALEETLEKVHNLAKEAEQAERRNQGGQDANAETEQEGAAKLAEQRAQGLEEEAEAVTVANGGRAPQRGTKRDDREAGDDEMEGNHQIAGDTEKQRRTMERERQMLESVSAGKGGAQNV